MRRTPKPAALLLLTALLGVVTGCGSDGSDVAADPEPTSSVSPSPSVSPTPSPTAGPTTSPTVGTYPLFAPTDYTYMLAVQCFCPAGGTPIAVTVADGAVASATYTGDAAGKGAAAGGTEVNRAFWLTINDVIAAANDTTAATVDVDWPAGQAYPHRVRVDKDLQMADEETDYTISDVVAAPAG